MTHSELDDEVLGMIIGGQANTNTALVVALKLPLFDEEGRAASRVIENVLKRLKTKGKVSFDKGSKRWVSEVSAPVGDSDVVSEGQTAQPPQTLTETTGTTMNQSSTTNVDDIDAAINKARAGKSKPENTEAGSKRARLTPEEKTARDAQRAQEREAKKLEREQARSAKKQAGASAKKPAHMSKVDKAASKLPSLNDYAQGQLNELTTNMSRDQVFALAQHLLHFNRTQATERALGQVVKQGYTVTITGGDPRYIGRTGIVAKAQRIRCYVELEGVKKPAYLFTSDVQVVSMPEGTAVAV